MGFWEWTGFENPRDSPKTEQPKEGLPQITDNVRDSGQTFVFGRSNAGEQVDEKAAMQIPTVYACVRLLAESIAALPLHLYRVFNVGEGRSGQVGYQMRRHTENTTDLRHGELLGLKELAVLWWQGNRFVAHSLFQHRNTMSVCRTPVCRLPVIPNPVGVLDDAGVFQYTAWLCAVLEKAELYLSTAIEVPRLFFIMAIGENPIRPLKPRPGTWKISSLRK